MAHKKFMYSTSQMEDRRNDQNFQESRAPYEDFVKKKSHFAKCTSSSSSSSFLEDSTISDQSPTSSLRDDYDDSSSSRSLSSSSQALYDLSEIMAQLPIKRGLSKFYQGKSESFASLASVTATQDLGKRRKVKGSRGLDNYRNYTLPKPIISKKSSKKRGAFMRLTPL